MTSPEKENLEKMLAIHLQKTLNSQRGKALKAFENLQKMQVKASARFSDEHPTGIWRIGKESRKLWLWAGIPSAIAAVVAVVIGGFFALHNSADSLLPVGGGASAAVVPVMMDQETVTRNVDGGTGMLADDTPVRVVREQTLRRTQWVDPQDRATYSVTEPIEKVGYVRIQPY